MTFATLALAFGALLPQAQPVVPKHRPEEFEYMLQKTGYVLPLNVLEGDLTLSHFEFDEFRRVGGRPDVDFDAFVAELAYGVTEWLTVEAELPFVRVDFDPGDSESGIGDIALEAKASLKRGGTNPIGFVSDVDLAAGVRVTLPTGDEDEGLGEEHATLAPFVAASYWVDSWVAVHARLLLEWQSERRPVHRFNATAEFIPWAPELSLMGGLQIEREGSDPSAISLIPGVEYRFPQIPLTPGASIPIGLTSRAPDVGFLLNVQYRF
ncbi:MAG TPA: transporter [Planctomycetota bacterium]